MTTDAVPSISEEKSPFCLRIETCLLEKSTLVKVTLLAFSVLCIFTAILLGGWGHSILPQVFTTTASRIFTGFILAMMGFGSAILFLVLHFRKKPDHVLPKTEQDATTTEVEQPKESPPVVVNREGENPPVIVNQPHAAMVTSSQEEEKKTDLFPQTRARTTQIPAGPTSSIGVTFQGSEESEFFQQATPEGGMIVAMGKNARKLMQDSFLPSFNFERLTSSSQDSFFFAYRRARANEFSCNAQIQGIIYVESTTRKLFYNADFLEKTLEEEKRIMFSVSNTQIKQALFKSTQSIEIPQGATVYILGEEKSITITP